MLGSLSVLACEQRLSPARRAHAEQGVRARIQVWVTATNNRDLDSLATLYHQGPETTVIDTGGTRTRGWRALAARQRDWAAQPYRFNYLVQDVTVDVVSEEVAVSHFRTSLDTEAVGTRRVVTGLMTQVWSRDADGAPWTIRAEHHSSASVPENR